jgi:hypothetical protein
MANAALSTTLGSANAQVGPFDTGDNTAMSATVTGTFVGTVTFQVLYDATEGWVSAPCVTRAGAAATSTLTAPGSRFINVSGALSVRALMNPYVSGTAEVTFAASPAISVAAASSGGGGGGAATIADGADVAEGSTTDTAVTGDNAGTVNAHLRGLTKATGDNADTAIVTDIAGSQSGFLRGLVKIFADVWNSSLHYLAVGGVAAAGVAPSGNPVSVSGVDGGNLKRHVKTDTSGNLQVGLVTTLNEANDSVTGHVGGYSKVATLTITRPANTSPYLAGDEIADVAGTAAQRTFAAARVNNGTGVITGCALIYSNNPVATPSLELYLFDTDPTSAGDNGAFAPTDAQLATSIGVITFPAPKVGTTGTSGNLLYDSGPVSIQFAATGGTTSLFGLLVTRIGFTPIANSEVITIRLRCEQN